MSKRIFSEEQIKELSQNPNVERCSERSITYHKDFKLSAIEQYRKGLPPNEIFRQARFNIDMIGREKPKWCIQRWREILKDKGIQQLTNEVRGKNGIGGRPKTNWSNDKERIKYLETKIAYLKAENNFLAKLRKKS